MIVPLASVTENGIVWLAAVRTPVLLIEGIITQPVRLTRPARMDSVVQLITAPPVGAAIIMAVVLFIIPLMTLSGELTTTAVSAAIDVALLVIVELVEDIYTMTDVMGVLGKEVIQIIMRVGIQIIIRGITVLMFVALAVALRRTGMTPTRAMCAESFIILYMG